MAIQELAARFVAETRELDRGLAQAQGKVNRFGSNIATTLKRAVGAFAVGAFVKDSFSAFTEAEDVAVKLANSVENSGKLAKGATSRFLELASAIQGKTRADDESIASGAAILAQFDLNEQQIRSVLPLVVDYARKTGKDVPTAAGLLGKAMLGNTRALKEIGINYKAGKDAGKTFADVTDLVREKVGGFAEQEAQTAAGRLDIMKNKFNDLQERVGGFVAGALTFFLDHMKQLAPVIAGVVTALGTYKLIVLASTVATKAFGVSSAAAWVAAAGPIALIVAAVAAAVAAIIIHWDKVKTFVKGLWKFLSDGFKLVGHGIAEAFRWAVNKAIDFLALLVKPLDLIIKGVNLIPGVDIPELGSILKGLKLEGNSIGKAIDSGVGGGGAKQFRQHGGAVTAMQPYVVGERGPELFVPKSDGMIHPRVPGASGNVYITINVRGSVIAENELGEIVRRALLRRQRQVRTLGLAN